MTQQAVNAAVYYNDHVDQEQSYAHITVASPVKTNDNIVVNAAFGFNIQTRVDEDGYHLTDYAAAKPLLGFLSTTAFNAQAIRADSYELAAPRHELPEAALSTLQAVRKDDTIYIDTGFGIPAETKAPCSGAVAVIEGSRVFLSNFELTSKFNNIGGLHSDPEVMIVTSNKEPLVKGIVLRETVTFDFKDGEFTAPAGSFLFANPKDVDGYTVYPPEYAQMALRTPPKSALSVAPSV